MLEAARVVVRAGRDSRTIDTAAPWAGPRAKELDGLSAADWLRLSHLHPDSHYLFDRLIGSLASQNLAEISCLQVLWLVRMAGDPVRTFATTFQWRIAEGAQQLSRRMARELGDDSIHLGSPVRRILQQNNTIDMVTEDLHVRARRAIVATPVRQVANITFDPPLPQELRGLSQLHVGAGTKVVARLPDMHRAKHNTVIGGKLLWGAWRRGDIVTGFVPPMAGDVSDGDLIDDLANAFGVPSTDDLRYPTVFRWAEEDYIGGCDAAFAPGQVCGFGPQLAAPHGLMSFAGVARSSWPDNMEGAVRSGERAADEVLASL